MKSIDEAELALQLADQVEHRALDRDVERGGDLVGDEHLRAAGERPGEGDALPLPAGELRRVRVAARAGSRWTSSSSRATSARALGAAPSRAAAPRRCSRRSSSAGRARSTGPGRPSAAGAAGRVSGPARRRAGSGPQLTGASPTAARASVDLPDPDSPTRPTTSPAGTVRLTPSTAVVASPAVADGDVVEAQLAHAVTSSRRARRRVGRSVDLERRSARRRASRRPGGRRRRSRAAGPRSRQWSSASGQRAAYAQPAGTSAGSTGRPGMTASGRSRSVSMSGTAATSARV